MSPCTSTNTSYTLAALPVNDMYFRFTPSATMVYACNDVNKGKTKLNCLGSKTNTNITYGEGTCDNAPQPPCAASPTSPAAVAGATVGKQAGASRVTSRKLARV